MSRERLSKQILELKNKKSAVILAHVYTLPEIQDIADYVGDSLGLSQKAAALSEETKIIVFCGVYFMAETAALLSPNKKVLLPDLKAGCPMAASQAGSGCCSEATGAAGSCPFSGKAKPAASACSAAGCEQAK